MATPLDILPPPSELVTAHPSDEIYRSEHVVIRERLALHPTIEDELLPYAVAEGVQTDLKPVLYVAGFNDVFQNYDNKIGLIRRFAGHDIGLIVPRNDRHGLQHDPDSGNPDAMLTQAENILTVIEAEELTDTTLPSVGHSMGGMVLTRVVQEAKRRGWKCFDEAPIALAASAGLNASENIFTLSGRFLKLIYTDRHIGDLMLDAMLENDTFSRSESMKDSMHAASANFLRTTREVWELSGRRIDLMKLSRTVGSVAVVQYAKDDLQTHKQLGPTMEQLFGADDAPDNVTYFTPYSTDVYNGEIIGARNAHHLDCVTCPCRVANSLAPFLLGKQDPYQNIKSTNGL